MTFDRPSAGKLPFISYAQNLEDVVLWRALSHVDQGIYVDVGAADPTEFSVTRAFYERGWSGINLEPAAHYADRLDRDRPRDRNLRVAAGDHDGEAVFHLVRNTGLSTLDGDLVNSIIDKDFDVFDEVVTLRRLDRILDEEYPHDKAIHLLKVDVEGAETQVFRGIDLARWRPWVIVAEATVQLSTELNFAEWDELIRSHGYLYCLFDGLNRFYVAEEHDELRSTLSYPACSLDQPFVRHAKIERTTSELRKALEATEETYSAGIAAHEHLLRTADSLTLHLEHLLDQNDGGASQIEALQHKITDYRQSAEVSSSAATRWRIADERSCAEAVEIKRIATEIHQDGLVHQRTAEAVRENTDRVLEELASIRQTVSWKSTAPLRAIHRTRPPVAGLAVGVEPLETEHIERATLLASLSPSTRHVFEQRLHSLGALLSEPPIGGTSGRDQLAAFEFLLRASHETDMRKAWICCVAATGAFPDEDTLRRVDRLLFLNGPSGVGDEMLAMLTMAPDSASDAKAFLEIVADEVVVDVSGLRSMEPNSDRSRVASAVVRQWLQREDAHAVEFDGVACGLVRSELRPKRGLDAPHSVEAATLAIDDLLVRPEIATTVVPWDCDIMIPTAFLDPRRANVYRALALSGVVRSFSMVMDDISPVTAAEYAVLTSPGEFAYYLSTAKTSGRVSATSESVARDVRGFCASFASQGIAGPDIAVHPLPPLEPIGGTAEVEILRSHLGVGSAPLVLIAGSHEPNNNHMLILAASEVLWKRGHRFELLFVDSNGWHAADFERQADRLRSAGCWIHDLPVATELTLWAAHRLARFSIHTPITGGYGLPAIESLRCSTPVIASNYGPIAELGSAGVVFVDPRSPEELIAAMTRLLDDDNELEELRQSASERSWESLEQYADDVWDYFRDAV